MCSPLLAELKPTRCIPGHAASYVRNICCCILNINVADPHSAWNICNRKREANTENSSAGCSGYVECDAHGNKVADLCITRNDATDSHIAIARGGRPTSFLVIVERLAGYVAGTVAVTELDTWDAARSRQNEFTCCVNS